MVAGAAFLFASRGGIKILLLIEMLLGICLVMGGSCVFNNYIDRNIDTKMERTSKRALASGKIGSIQALAYGTVLSAAGFALLAAYTNNYALGAAILGFVVYVAVYGYFKRRSVHGTTIGAVAGAVPPVVGYTAATQSLGGAALLLFVTLFFWQLPHFYSIAIKRLKDYKTAGLPMLPVVIGVKNTKRHIMAYIVAFSLACVALTVWGYTSYLFLVALSAVCLWWLYWAWAGFSVTNNTVWAQKMFKQSLVVLLVFSLAISLDGLFA